MLQHIISPSKSSKNDIQNYFHVDTSKIHVIPNGIDTGIFKPNLVISKKPFKLITTASADVPLKGLDFTLRAIAVAKDKYLSFATAIALRVKSSPFKGTSALAVVINLNGFFEITRFGLNIPVSIPFGITWILLVSTWK